jgi:8-oxo-dGTP pyrophosphatase MutT (NUDIX family)
MDLSFLQQKEFFPSFVATKLVNTQIDYKEKYQQIKDSGKTGVNQLGAGVVLLLSYKETSHGKAEYVFQLIKRSNNVSQAGDISCPGGMLHPITDQIFSNVLTTGLIPSLHNQILHATAEKDQASIKLIRLFLTNAIREAWEEIGLSPFNFVFLGALPCYSLKLFARTIFPLVCLTVKPFEFKLSSEVDKIIEIPISSFYESSNYASLEIETSSGDNASGNNQFPCILISDNQGGQEILWGATFNIIMNFLRIISDNSLPFPSSTRTIKKILTKSYISRINT